MTTCWILPPDALWRIVAGVRAAGGTEDRPPALHAQSSSAAAAPGKSALLVTVREPVVGPLMHEVVDAVYRRNDVERSRRLVEIEGVVGRRRARVAGR